MRTVKRQFFWSKFVYKKDQAIISAFYYNLPAAEKNWSKKTFWWSEEIRKSKCASSPKIFVENVPALFPLEKLVGPLWSWLYGKKTTKPCCFWTINQSFERRIIIFIVPVIVLFCETLQVFCRWCQVKR